MQFHLPKIVFDFGAIAKLGQELACLGVKRPMLTSDKGLKAAGHMGSETVTTKNIQVVEIDAENNLLVVKGAVPGSISSYVIINKAGTPRTGK